jgi:hypothetical protein
LLQPPVPRDCNPTPGAPLSLRVLLDGSALEIFTSTGETLTTRVYRGHPPAPRAATATGPATAFADGGRKRGGGGGGDEAGAAAAAAEEEEEEEAAGCGVCLFAAGTPCMVATVEVFEVASCWQHGAPAGPAETAEEATAAEGGEDKDGAEGTAAAAAVVRSEFLQELHITE